MGFIGTANSSDDSFIGVNVVEVKNYVENICGTAIKAAITAANVKDPVFAALENGWTGQAMEHFEENFKKAIGKLEITLSQAFVALVKEIAATTDGMVEQDANMVELQ